MLEFSKIAIIGGGNITRAILSGFRMKNFPFFSRVYVSNRGQEKLNRLEVDFGIRAAKTNAEALHGAEAVFLAVKPQLTRAVCEDLSKIVQKENPLLISLVSGISLTDILSWCSTPKLSAIRTMTNTATAVGKGTTALYANDQTSALQKDFATQWFSTVGNTLWLPNELAIHNCVPLIGCLPAFPLLLAEALDKASRIHCGIPAEDVKKIILDTMYGAIVLAMQSGTPVEELRRQVTTPNGITAAATAPLLEADFLGLFEKAFTAAIDRSLQIEKGSQTSSNNLSAMALSTQSFLTGVIPNSSKQDPSSHSKLSNL